MHLIEHKSNKNINNAIFETSLRNYKREQISQKEADFKILPIKKDKEGILKQNLVFFFHLY